MCIVTNIRYDTYRQYIVSIFDNIIYFFETTNLSLLTGQHVPFFIVHTISQDTHPMQNDTWSQIEMEWIVFDDQKDYFFFG